MKTTRVMVAAILGFGLGSVLLLHAQTGNSASGKIPPYEATARLMNAVQYNGKAEDIRFLLENGADANAKDNEGWHALQLAAKRGDIEIVRLLLEKGANINATNSWGVTSLGSAAFRGYIDIVKLLLEKGADMNVKYDGYSTALSSAADGGYTNVIALLLDKGANINERDWSGDTILMKAASNGKTDVVKILLARGANVNAEDTLGYSALDEARKITNAVIVRLLQDAGAGKSTAVKRDEEMRDSLNELEKSQAALSNSLRNTLQSSAESSPASEKQVNLATVSGGNTDKSGYVTNVALLTPFTLTNASGTVITNAVLVKLMPNKFIYKTPSGGGMLPLASLPQDLLDKIGYDPEVAKAADEAEQQKKTRERESAQQQMAFAAQQNGYNTQSRSAVSDVSRSIRAYAEICHQSTDRGLQLDCDRIISHRCSARRVFSH